MFRTLKKKLEQGVAQSKAVVAGLTKGDESNEENTSSEFLDNPVAESTPQKSVDQSRYVVEDFTTPVFSVAKKNRGSLRISADTNLSEGSGITRYETASDTSSLQGYDLSKGNRSRTSSVSSMISEGTFSPSISLSRNYSLLSDNESEAEDTINLSSVSKEDLHAFIKRFEQRAFKYKSKFMELATAYKDVLQERDKLKSLAQSQDGSFRPTSDLDQPARQDVEDKYRFLLEEKDEFTKVLQIQVKLLKEGKEIPEELETKLVDLQAKIESSLSTIGGVSRGNSSTSEDVELLKSRIKRQDNLLQKCKDTITSYKEKISQLSQDKQELLGKLELTSKVGDKNNSQTPDQMSRLQAQIQEARKVIKQLESDREVAIAEVKQQIHEEMEKKDTELEHVKGQQHKFATENHNLKLEIERLTNDTEDLQRINQEQLEKARNIMRKLKEDKKLALEQAEARIRQAEESMEEEKEKMLSDLKRGKAEAFSVIQLESEKNLAEKVESAVEERDKFWKKKMAAQEVAHHDMLQSKDREKEMALTAMHEEVRHKLNEKEDEVRLALEERELQKMAALTGLDEQKDILLLQIEELSSEKIKLSNRLSKFQEDTEQQISKLKVRLSQKEAEHKKIIYELQHNNEEFLKKERNMLNQKAADEIELLKQRHTEEIQNLTYTHEQDLQDSTTELESYYKNQFQNEKEKLENLLAITKEQLEEMRSSYSLNQAKLMDTEQPLTKAETELAHANRKQDLNVEVDSIEQAQQHFSELTQNQDITDQENNTDIHMLEESNSELRQMFQIVSEELKSVKEALAVAESELLAGKTENCKREEVLQQKFSESECEGGKSNSQSVQELSERIIELNEEYECLKRNVENSKIRVDELERCLEETVKEKKSTESKAREFEIQVGQLQEVIRTLESCQNTVENEKASLEHKLTFLENIVEDLKASKEELNEKLHGRHEALIQQYTDKKQALELRISEFSTQVGNLKEEIDSLNKAMLSKNDENMALRSIVHDNSSFVKTLETKIEKLTAELQMKSQTNSNNEAALAKSLEKFEKLKNEANVKIKGLKEMKDSLTEQLNKQQKEYEDIKNSFVSEKDTLTKVYEERLSKQEEAMKNLELTFREQFETKHAKFKEAVSKLKERHENKLKEKEKQFDDFTKELLSKKELSIGELTKSIEKFKNDQLKYPEQKPVDSTANKLETKLQTASPSHSQEPGSISSCVQQNSGMQQKLSDNISFAQELSSASNLSVQPELDKILLQMKEMSEKHLIETDTLNLQLAEKTAQIQHLTASLESFDNQSLSEQKESLTLQIQSLTESLIEKDAKLESMAGTISAEQESLYKQLAYQTERAVDLQSQKNALSLQLKETIEKHDAQLQEKETLLNELNQKITFLEEDHSSVKDILRTSHDVFIGNDSVSRSLPKHVKEFKMENDDKLQSLESQLETKNNNITALEEELILLKQNHATEANILKSNWESQITELQMEIQALKSQLKEANEKLQEGVEMYENKLVDEKSKLERHEVSFNEQINVLKQQLYEVQSQADVSSNLLQNAKDGEDMRVNQLQEEIKNMKQDAEQTVSDLKQKYTVRLKEIQTQAKNTINELEETLLMERSAKSQMYTELTRANTRLLQFEENSGTSRDTIVDLEQKVIEMAALIKSKDSELTKLKTDMEESEKNMQEILEETQVNCKLINDRLIETETKLKANESDLTTVNEQLQSNLALLQQKEIIVHNLESRCSELEKICSQENEKHEHEEKVNIKRCFELEEMLEKTRTQFDEAQNRCAELDYKVQSTGFSLTELESVQAEKSHLQNDLSRLCAEKEELNSKLLETETAFEQSLKEHALLVKELESRLSESKSQKEQIKQEYETKQSNLQLSHATELSEMSVSMEAQISAKVSEYKKKAEAYIAQMKKQLQDDHTILYDKQQENITKLEESIIILTEEISSLKQSNENLAAENENIIQNMKSEVEQVVKLKQSVTEEYCEKEQEFEQSMSSMQKEIDSLLLEKNLLLEKLTVIEKAGDDSKMQSATVIEELKSRNVELFKSLESLKSTKEDEVAAFKVELEESMQKLQKSHQAALEEQSNEHASEMEWLIKETNQKAEMEKETRRNEFVDKSEQCGQDLEDQKIVDELRKEILQKDKHTEELHTEYQSKIQVLENEQKRKIYELQSELMSTQLSYEQEIEDLEMKLKLVQQNDDDSRESPHQEEAVSMPQELNSANKETFEQSARALSAYQRGASENTLLQEQVNLLTRHIDQMKEQHKQELAEINSRLKNGNNSSLQPLVVSPANLNMDTLDPNFSQEMHNLELKNMDLQAQVSQLYGEVSMYKIRERDLLKKMEKLEHVRRSTSDDDDPPLSLDASFMNHTDSAIFREPTEFEYLKNILYQYMMGRETKTLAKVIATVVRFSDEQMKNVLDKADTRLVRK